MLDTCLVVVTKWRARSKFKGGRVHLGSCLKGTGKSLQQELQAAGHSASAAKRQESDYLHSAVIFIQPRPPAHGMMSPSVSTETCLLGDSRSCQGDSLNCHSLEGWNLDGCIFLWEFPLPLYVSRLPWVEQLCCALMVCPNTSLQQ